MDEYQQKLMAVIAKAKSENDQNTVNKANVMLNNYAQQKGTQPGGQPPVDPNAYRQEDTSAWYPGTKGVGFGYGDEALAGIMATFAAIKGDIQPNQVGDMYNSVKSEIEAMSDAYSEEHPVKGFGAEVVPSAGAGIASSGTLLGTKIPSLIEKFRTTGLLSAGTLGAIEAFVYGSGQGDALEPGENITPEIPFYGHVGDTTYEPKLEDPYLNEIISEVGGRALSGLEDIPMGYAGGAAGARIGDAITSKLGDTAAAKKWTREGFEDPETARYALEDPSQRQIPPPVEPDQNLMGLQDEGFAPEMPDAQFGETAPEMPFEQSPADLIPEKPEGFVETASELASPFKPKVIKPSSASAAAHQDVNPNMLTNIREANKPTLDALGELTNTFKRYKKTDARGSNSPYKFIGQEFDLRIQKILDENKKAMDLQRNARDSLEEVKGVDLSQVANDVFEGMQTELKAIGINADEAVLDFKGLDESSPLQSKDAQKFLQSVWTDFLNSPNAGKLHDLRRNIDLKINHNKANMTSFDDQTTKILKKFRTSIRESLNQFSPEYAEANRVLSQNLKALENLEQAFPQLKTQYNLDDPDDYTAALEYVGQQLRLLDSNAAAAPKIERSIIQFDRLAEEYGGKFDVDISKLVRHNNLLKRQFGDKAQSIGGILGAETDKLVSAMKGKGSKYQAGKEMLNPMLGKTEDNAYQSILDYIAEISKTHKTGGAK